MRMTLITAALLLAPPATPAVPTQVTFLQSASVDQAFAEGRPLLEERNYKVHASRRQAPGEAEVHLRDTDIIYVLEGAATLVTGGRALEPRTIAAEEIRGRAIDGGEERRLSKGDVLVVPSGVPHWFKEVRGPLLYYVVKVRQEPGSSS